MDNRTWLITGVSSGLGYEMTKQLLENGIQLLVLYVILKR